MSLESVCDLIILFGTAYFMILKMIDSFAKPTSKLKKKRVRGVCFSEYSFCLEGENRLDSEF